jgi:predicted Rossmann-fold nucleotide-binding protein
VKRICVFCGSSEGARPAYAEAARSLDQEIVGAFVGLAQNGIG